MIINNWQFIKDMAKAKFIAFFILVPCTLLGLIIIPINLLALLITGKDKLPLGNGIWGNTVDTLDGSGKFQAKYSYLPRIVRRFIWLAIRNPTENLKRFKLGLYWGTSTLVDGHISTRPFPSDLDKNPGFSYSRVWATGHDWDSKEYFEYYYVSKPYKFLFTERCIRVRIGWKIGEISKRRPGEVKAFEFSINPFRKWGGDLNDNTN